MAAITPVPSALAFKERFPIFGSIAKETIDATIAEAMASVDDTWIEADQVPALFYLVAHMLTREGALATTPSAAAAVVTRGPVTSIRVGDVSTSYASGGGSSSEGGGSSALAELEMTTWGRRYLALMKRSFPAVLVV